MVELVNIPKVTRLSTRKHKLNYFVILQNGLHLTHLSDEIEKTLRMGSVADNVT